MAPEVFYKKTVRKNFAIFIRKYLYWSPFSFFQKRFYQKDTPTQVFSCEYSEISKNTYFEEHVRTAASEVSLESDCLGLSFCTVTFKTILT